MATKYRTDKGEIQDRSSFVEADVMLQFYLSICISIYLSIFFPKYLFFVCSFVFNIAFPVALPLHKTDKNLSLIVTAIVLLSCLMKCFRVKCKTHILFQRILKM